eukprot:gene25740-11401_t
MSVPNLFCRCLDAYMSLNGRVYLVFEHIEKTLSRELIFRPQGLSTMSVKIIFWQLLNGTSFLHNRGIIHRDLKPANVLLTGDGVVKICDFGFARCIYSSDDDGDPLAITRWYRAPEVLAEGEYGPGVDVWALGCILAELSTGSALLAGDDRIDQLRLIAGLGVGDFSEKQKHTIATDVRLGRFMPPAPGDVPILKERLPEASPELLELLHACLCPDPLKRPSAEQLMSMAWFEGVEELVPKEALDASSMFHADGSPVGQPDSKLLRPLTTKDLSRFVFPRPSIDVDQPPTPPQVGRARFAAMAPSPVYQPLMQQLLGETQLLHLVGEDGDDLDYPCSLSFKNNTPSLECESPLLMTLSVSRDDYSGAQNRDLSTPVECPSLLRSSVVGYVQNKQNLAEAGLELVGKVKISHDGRLSPSILTPAKCDDRPACPNYHLYATCDQVLQSGPLSSSQPADSLKPSAYQQKLLVE